MTMMVATAYKTKPNITDQAIALTLVAGLTGQLKGWWDNYLDEVDRNNILFAYKRNEKGIIVKDETREPNQDSVSILIFAIAKYFLGDPSNLKDRSSEVLTNLRCKNL